MPPSLGDLLRLARWNTPTIYNGWEQITSHDVAASGWNPEETRDFMPQMGPMVGRAITLVIEPSNASHKARASAWDDYRRHVALGDGPRIVVVEDLDRPRVAGSFWGEVNANVHRALGCVGTITDGGIRDLDEMTAAGFKALARRLCVGHAHVAPVRWGEPVTVFGRTIAPGQLVHADKHGFLAIPAEDEAGLFEAAAFMDENECDTVIAAARDSAGASRADIVARLSEASRRFAANARERFDRHGEW
jgi:4-hydroxy-4-methyl-2-oxoglutarate aldolase